MNEPEAEISLPERKEGCLVLAGNHLSYHSKLVSATNIFLTIYIDCELAKYFSKPNHDSIKIAELKCTGEAYMCGNCNATLIPPSQESDLEKQLNLQRIQQQIELEAIQHQQRMKHLQTLLHS